jgi:hypothetical protein
MKFNFIVDMLSGSFELLKLIKEKGYAEYRDPEFEDLQDFKKNNISDLTESNFLTRNTGGTKRLIAQLLIYKFVKASNMDWHLCYELTSAGKMFLKQMC